MSGVKLLEGKNAIVTGARRGIGRAILEKFAENGANVWAFVRSQDEAFESEMRALAEACKVRISPVYADMQDEKAIKAAVQAVIKEKTPVDALVNNAGVSRNVLFQMTSMDALREQFDVNFFAPFLLTQMVCRIMLKYGGGSIVNIASSAGIDGNAGRSAYGASKAAVISLTRTLADELGPSIRVNAIAPGVTDTDMISNMTEQVISDTVGRQALKKIGEGQDIANAAVFLASSAASYITGQVLRVDGGML